MGVVNVHLPGWNPIAEYRRVEVSKMSESLYLKENHV